MGKKKKPSYRVVVVDSRAPRDGAFIEVIGHYDPLTNPITVVIDAEKARKWLGQGAQPTQTVNGLLKRLGITDKPTTGITDKPTIEITDKPTS